MKGLKPLIIRSLNPAVAAWGQRVPPPTPEPEAPQFGPLAGTAALVVMVVATAAALLYRTRWRATSPRRVVQDTVASAVSSAVRKYTQAASPRHKICIVGSGNWGSAISRVVGRNAAAEPSLDATVSIWVYEEQVEGQNLTDIINTTHVNV